MEQARYLIWDKRSKSNSNLYNNILAPPPPPASINLYGDSWEEQAFAVDASGVLGGCVWPPRSYSCSFCRREFRSAQALGGHMNVHRRDRARLKQSPINIPPPSPPASEVVPGAVNPCTRQVSFDHASPYSSQICTDSMYDKNPNPEIRVSSPDPPHTNKLEEIKSSTLSLFSPIFQHSHIVNHTVNVPQSWSSFISKKRERLTLDLIENNVDMESRAEKDDCVTEDHLSVSLNSVVCERKKKATSYEEEVGSCNKRRRTDQENPSKSSGGVDICNPFHESDELDLELRLGGAPKVK